MIKASGSGNKALIVDDHPFIRATVRHLLKAEGFADIDEAGTGADALQKVREGRPALIILDLAIPKLGGLEVISRVKALGVPCKILVLTSFLPEFFPRGACVPVPWGLSPRRGSWRNCKKRSGR